MFLRSFLSPSQVNDPKQPKFFHKFFFVSIKIHSTGREGLYSATFEANGSLWRPLGI